MNRSLFVVLVVLGLAACNTAPDIKVSSNESALISDQVHSGGTPGFFFMQPMVSPTTYGTFLPGLDPTVTIEELSGAGVIATFTRTSGTNGVLVTDNGASFYEVVWDTGLYQLSTTLIYRIHVYLQGYELGIADVQVCTSKREAKNVDTNEYIPLVDDKKLQIRFRIQPETRDSFHQWFNLAPFPTTIFVQGSVIYGNQIYIIGGVTEAFADPTGTAYHATILPTGNLSDWVETTPLPIPVGGLAAAEMNGYVYVSGGADNLVGQRTEVMYAPILSDGSLGQWNFTTPLPSPRMNHTSVAYNGRIYVFGGNYGNAWVDWDDSLVADVLPDGQLGAWVNTTPLPTPREGHNNIVYNGRMYLIGGTYNDTIFDGIYYASIGADGLLGEWVPTTPISGLRYYAGAVTMGNKLFLMGGMNYGSWGGECLADTISADFLSDGGIGPWSPGPSFPSARANFTVNSYNGRIYSVGGYQHTPSLNDVMVVAP